MGQPQKVSPFQKEFSVMQKEVALSGDRLALRMRELAKALGLSVRTVWALTKEKTIPHVRLGSSVLYPVDSIRQWLHEQVTANQQSPDLQASGGSAKA